MARSKAKSKSAEKRSKGQAAVLYDNFVQTAMPRPGKTESLYRDAGRLLYLRVISGAKGIERYWLRLITVGPRKGKRATIAKVKDMSLAEAREEAAKVQPEDLPAPAPSIKSSVTDVEATLERKPFGEMTLLEVVDWHINQSGFRKNTSDAYNVYRNMYINGSEYANSKACELEYEDAQKLIDRAMYHGHKTTPGAAAKLANLCAAAYVTSKQGYKGRFYNPFQEVKDDREYVRKIVNTSELGRALDDDEVRAVWFALNSTTDGVGAPAVARALMFMLVTGQRSRECTALHERELKTAADGATWWHIPPERIKTITVDTKPESKREHILYMSPLALRIIGRVPGHKFPGEEPHYVFEGKKPGSPVNVGAAAHLVRRKRGTSAAPDPLGVTPWTPNDLRVTVETRLDKPLNCPANIYNAILNHSKDKIAKLYNMNEYLEYKKEWLIKWSDYLEELIGVGHTSKIRFVDQGPDIERLQELVSSGTSNIKIAAELGVSETWVRKLRQQYNIKKP